MKTILAAVISLLAFNAAVPAFAQSQNPTVTPYICVPDGVYDGAATAHFVNTGNKLVLALHVESSDQGLGNSAGAMFGNFNNSDLLSSVSFSVKGTIDPTYGPWVVAQIVGDGTYFNYEKNASAGTVVTNPNGWTTVTFTPSQLGIAPATIPALGKLFIFITGPDEAPGFDDKLDNFILNGAACIDEMQAAEHSCPLLEQP